MSTSSTLISRTEAFMPPVSRAPTAHRPLRSTLQRRKRVTLIGDSPLAKASSWCSSFCRDCPRLPSLTYCSVVNDSLDAASDSDSSEASESLTATTTWKSKLLTLSTYASWLCVLDCTVLPVVTTIFPLLGLVAWSSAQSEWLHQLGHQLALGFVLPVGSVATALNHSQHQTGWISLLGMAGLVLVACANAGCGAAHWFEARGGLIGKLLHDVLHGLHSGLWHRGANLAGCAFLMTSNYLSRRQHAKTGATCGHGPNCNHNH